MVVIIGGGLAGLAAAVALTEQGVPVTLLESRSRLGGRATSFEDATTGELVDNCQHVSMGCCTNLAHFCRTTGIEDRFTSEDVLTFIGPDGRRSRFAAMPTPAPTHLIAAFMRLPYLSLREKLALRRGIHALARWEPVRSDATLGSALPSHDPDRSFLDWLRDEGQPSPVIDRFWQVVMVSALSESLDRIDIGHARKVIVDGFLAHRRGWEVQVPMVPLDELYGAPIIDWLSSRGAEVRLGCGVTGLAVEDGRVTGALLRNDESVVGADFVLAVPWHRVGNLLPDSLWDDPALAGIEQLETAPIASVHLWFDREVIAERHAVFVGRLSQWVFNRTAIQASIGRQPAEEPSDVRGFSYQVVISESRGLRGRDADGVIQEVIDELATIWPKVSDAQLLHSRLVNEQRAVFSPTPGVERLRPPQQTSIDNLQLAGDYTQTGWPATMEGAVRSGYLAAENILARQGQPMTLVQPDLPRSWLCRWLFGAE